jgi:carbon-monoxide dehydrogenase small subunit
MIIPVTINDEQTQIDADADAKLLQVLRQKGFTDTKCGCQTGLCGACTVLLNNLPVLSCLIPVALVRDANIVTLTHFTKTDCYADIKRAFDAKGIHLCGICDAGKIFAAYHLLSSSEWLDKSQVYTEVSKLACYCVDTGTIVQGILAAKTAGVKNGR